MNKSDTVWITVLGLFTLVVAIFCMPAAANSTNSGFRDAAAALTFMGAAAVAIERAIEAMWTFLGEVLGSYWPLSVIHQQVDTMVKDLNSAMKPFHDELLPMLDNILITSGCSC
jgi:hypothetical protein